MDAQLHETAMYYYPDAYFVKVSDKSNIYVLTNEAKKLLYQQTHEAYESEEL